MYPRDLVTAHFRLTPPQIAALKRLGVLTVEQLVRHFPTRYESAGASVRVSELAAGSKVTLFGVISGIKAKKLWKSKRNASVGTFEDSSGKVGLMWFNQPYIKSYIPDGSTVKLSGTVAGSSGKPYIANPEVEILPPGAVAEGLFETNSDNTVSKPAIFAVYPESRGITSLWFRHAVERAFSEGVLTRMEDPLPSDIQKRYNLPDMLSALVWIHTPEKETHAEAARKRFAFEEIFALQIVRAQDRAENDAQSSFPIQDGALQAKRFLKTTPYAPTGAQTRAIHEILKDFQGAHPMARLLEGDVGAGKTLVAAAAAYTIVTSRPPLKLASGEFGRLPDGSVANRLSGTLQVAYMAPTEILAQQHFQSFIAYFKDLPINIALITGSGCKKFPSKVKRGQATDISRTQLLKWVANGEVAMVVGTHALIQKSVQFQHLALAIVDEQHRFGTKQRRALAHKGDAAPHFLSMTATPIPRTLALTMYGDLDLSVLDELPPGRAKITTKLLKSSERKLAYEAIHTELSRGRQAYVICPRIEEPDPAKENALQAKSAKAEAKRLQSDIFPDYVVGLMHGAMKPAEKDEVMEQFTRGDIHILVATSVVEVGVNVPNATVILIEGAERFGLAQLHQLRGRVMRSSHPPLCFLLPETKGDASIKRLKALEQSSDGFKLAESDLETRGAGDLFGRKQWGVTDLGMEALKNVRLIQAAREEAQRIVRDDPTLGKHKALATRVASASALHHSE